MKNGNAQEETTKEISLGQFAEFAGAIVACLPREGFDAQYYIEPHNHKELRTALKNLFAPQLVDNNFQEQVIDWQNFYKEVFGLIVDFSKTIIPNNTNANLNFLQFMLQGLTYQQVHSKEKEMYLAFWDWDDNWPNQMDMKFEERKTDKNYAIWHSGNTEADEIYKNKSANWILKNKIKTMTRLEGAVFGLYLLWKHYVIIDQKVISLWSGSRFSDGDVPRSRWSSDNEKFNSGWCFSYDGADGLRPRPVVS